MKHLKNLWRKLSACNLFGADARKLTICATVILFSALSAQAQPRITAGSNPVIVPNGQASGATAITWKAAPDYAYSEIYLSVDNGQWAEFARGGDGTKSTTIKPGSSQTFRMMVYQGQAGTPTVITTLTITATQGTPASSPPGGGLVILSDAASGINRNSRDSDLRNLILNIRDVHVEAAAYGIIMRFQGPPNQVPLVSIGRAAPILSNGEWDFKPEQLVGRAFIGPAAVSALQKATGSYSFSSYSNSDIRLEMGTTYYYIITVAAASGSHQDTGSFTTPIIDEVLTPVGGDGGGKFINRCPQGQLLAGVGLRAGDDVDAIRPICVTASAPAAVGKRVAGGIWSGGNGGSPRQLVCPNNAPIVTGMYMDVQGADTRIVTSIHIFCGLATRTQEPSQIAAASFDGSPGLGSRFGCQDCDVTQRCPDGLVAVGINGRSGVWLDAVGLICSTPQLARANSENTGTTSSALNTQKPVVKAVGRTKVTPAPGTTPAPPRPICDVAKEARARNSPAAPGLEEQCRANLASKGAAIAQSDQVLARARAAEPDAQYRQGFDIATGIFGNPALGAQGNTELGPGSQTIRDSLSAAGQRGFDAAVKLHLSRNYKP